MTTPETPACPHEEAVAWNPLNGVVQCHRCGAVFVPSTGTNDDLAAKLYAANQEVARLNKLAADQHWHLHGNGNHGSQPKTQPNGGDAL
jgi:ribosomal protein S27E